MLGYQVSKVGEAQIHAMFAVADMDEYGVATWIKQPMHLNCGFSGARMRLQKDTQTQIDSCGVEHVDHLFQPDRKAVAGVKSSGFLGLPHCEIHVYARSRCTLASANVLLAIAQAYCRKIINHQYRSNKV